MIEGVTRHDFQNHKSAILELLQEIEFVDEAKAIRIFNKINDNFSDYKDFSSFHFTEKRLSGAIFSHQTSKFTEIGRSLKIAYMSVRKAYQGEGIAKELLENFLSVARHAFDNIVLTSYENNHRGIKFYTKHNFVPYRLNRTTQYEIKDQGTDQQHRDIVFIRRFPLQNISIRPLRTSNIKLLKEMVLKSFQTNNELFNQSSVDDKEIAKYYENWDSKREIGFIARYKDKDIGAIWARKFPYYEQGFGYIEDHIPEMGLAVYHEYRGRGLGQSLMNHLFTRLGHLGETAVSVFVHADNPAKRAYIRNNFKAIRREGNNLVMLKRL